MEFLYYTNNNFFTLNALCFDILNNFNYMDYFEIDVMYYDALYDYNKYHNFDKNNDNKKNETIDEARERLLKNRPTVDKSIPVLFEANFLKPKDNVTSPLSIAPGIAPHRLADRKPKCFFCSFQELYWCCFDGISCYT